MGTILPTSKVILFQSAEEINKYLEDVKGEVEAMSTMDSEIYFIVASIKGYHSLIKDKNE